MDFLVSKNAYSEIPIMVFLLLLEIIGNHQRLNFLVHSIFAYNIYQVAFCGCPEVTPTPTIQIWQKVPRLKAEYLVQRIECTSGQFSPHEWTELGPMFGVKDV